MLATRDGGHITDSARRGTFAGAGGDELGVLGVLGQDAVAVMACRRTYTAMRPAIFSVEQFTLLPHIMTGIMLLTKSMKIENRGLAAGAGGWRVGRDGNESSQTPGRAA